MAFLGTLLGDLDCLALASRVPLGESGAIQSSLGASQVPLGGPQMIIFGVRLCYFQDINQLEVQGGSRPREAQPKILVYIYIYINININIYIYI